jgi:polysaccharide biosynthesis/export protein
MAFKNQTVTVSLVSYFVKRQYPLIVLLIAMMISPSCIPHKKILYLQQQAQESDTIQYVIPEYRIKPGDILYIQVHTLDEKSYTMFNSDRTGQRTTQATGGGGIGNVQMFLTGYNVGENGYVKMPVVGDVLVAGKTVDEATQTIEKEVAEYLIGATIIVKLVNFSVTVLGEVRSPGKYYIYDNKINIIDIIALSGNLTNFGNRKITVVRQSASGANFGTIDINDAAAIRSEYFYLQPNDIVYVEPYKLERFGISQFPISLVFSSVSFVLFLVTYFSK